MINVSIINESVYPNPEYVTYNSAGFDLRANVKEPILLKNKQKLVIPTGLKLGIPKGYALFICSRSGLAAKNSICVLNDPGVIDSDYRGELMVILYNAGESDFIINPGDRIAQGVVIRYSQVLWNVVDSLDNTERGEGGLGHSGIK